MALARSLLRAGLFGRCPHCGRAPMFSGFYSMHEVCPVCGTRFQTAEGAWLGAIAIGYGFGALFAILAAVVELTWAPLRAVGLPPLWTIGTASLVVTALAYRPSKGLWFGLLYRYGFMSTAPEGVAISRSPDAPRSESPRAR